MQMDSIQGFFESTGGQWTAILAVLVLFGLILVSGRDRKPDTQGLVLSAVFVALYVALNQLTIFRFPQGGSMTAFSMLAITACAYLLGTRRAVMAGMCAGLLELIFNPYVIHPVQLLLDYPLAVGALGLAGLLRHGRFSVPFGYLIGVLARYLCVVLSGIVFFGAYAPEGFNAVTWSVYYNIIYIGAEAVLTLPVLFLPVVRNTLARLQRQTAARR